MKPILSILLFAVVFPGLAGAQPSAATYTVTFESTWSAATHPDGFPPNPHFSRLIGGTHDASVVFWSEGELASPGIKDMAERGRQDPLRSEVQAAIDTGAAGFVLDGGNLSPSPGAVSLTFDITTDHPLVTLVTMLAPSPDWFVGVAGLPLHENDAWVEEQVVELFTYDAGTDSGTTYTADDEVTNPPVPIALIEGGSFLVEGEVRSIGTFTFTLQSGTPTAIDPRDEVPKTHVLSAVYPNPFNPTASFTLSVSTQQHVRITLVDVRGKAVAMVYEGMLPPGAAHRFALEAGGLPSGVYWVRAEGERFYESRPVILLK